MQILGVRVDNLTRDEILEKIKHFLNEDRFHQIATTNQEFLLTAGKDEEFKNILNSCDLNVADSMGLNWPFWLNFQKLRCRFAGADLMAEILKIANEKKLKVFLACSREGLSSYAEISKVIKNRFPNIETCGADIDRQIFNFQFSISNCDIIICNFGHPDQEKFLNSLKDDKIKLAMGVGGSFDFLTGKIRRAPKLMRKMGLEWLWRLILEPRYRFKRVWRALIVFPFTVFFTKN